MPGIKMYGDIGSTEYHSATSGLHLCNLPACFTVLENWEYQEGESWMKTKLTQLKFPDTIDKTIFKSTVFTPLLIKYWRSDTL